ncbi:MAG: Uma2 family endonuclease [Armatimonadetes bacterium]|nr:Uma2 family endonuclease [Armatimonadota bacterium]
MATLTAPIPQAADEIIYPESDGKRMADSTEQARWMTFLYSNLENWYKEDPNVFVAIDLLWYPVKGESKTTYAPDVMLVFGRPKFPRRSYLQWEENDVAPQVVFEIVSRTNTPGEMMAKSAFYQRYGVEECYLYDPDTGSLEVVLFTPQGLQYIAVQHEWTSPRLGIRFVPVARAPMEVYLPDGEPFRTLAEQTALTRFHSERADAERERADAERAAKERLADKLRALGIDPDTIE